MSDHHPHVDVKANDARHRGGGRCAEDRALFERYMGDVVTRSSATMLGRALPAAWRASSPAATSAPEEPFDDLLQVACAGPRQRDRPLRPRPRRGVLAATRCRRSSARSSATSATARWSVRVPRDLQELALKVERDASELTREPHREPSVEEIAAARGHGRGGGARGARGSRRATRRHRSSAARHTRTTVGDTLADYLGAERVRDSRWPRTRATIACSCERSPARERTCCSCASPRT